MIVEVQQGKLKGIENKSVSSGKLYYSFLGIPFAEPPVGNLRFQPPQPPKNWDGVRSAEKAGNDCFQLDFMNRSQPPKFKGSEDCLYLNVHTPELPSKVKTHKPVMVFVHGGAFMMGSGAPDFHSPDFLLDYDVIVVGINYRLHVLGFLDMGTQNCPGNIGLKDQVMALQWVKQNIANFGGDSGNITLFGNSAGATSAFLHTLSPLSKGLFNRIILLSPVMLLPEPVKCDPVEIGFKLGKSLSYEGTNADELVEFLKTKTLEELLQGSKSIHDNFKKEYPGCTKNGVLFAPSVELIKENAFLPDSVINLVKEAEPTPCLVGMNDMEGTLAAYAVGPEWIEKCKKDLSHVVKSNFQCGPNANELTAKIKDFYFSEKESKGESTDTSIYDIFSDIYFLNFYKIFDHIRKSNIPVYNYLFSLDGQFNMARRMGMSHIKGAGHGDEILYIFYRKIIFEGQPILDAELKAIKNLCSTLTNYSRTGDPNSPVKISNVEWKPCTAEQPCYLEINENIELKPGRIFEKRRAFWESVAHLFNNAAKA